MKRLAPGDVARTEIRVVRLASNLRNATSLRLSLPSANCPIGLLYRKIRSPLAIVLKTVKYPVDEKHSLPLPRTTPLTSDSVSCVFPLFFPSAPGRAMCNFGLVVVVGPSSSASLSARNSCFLYLHFLAQTEKRIPRIVL